MSQLSSKQVRIGVVEFLNAAPMVDGMSSTDGIELVQKVPSELIGCLERNEVDIALASSIDYQRSSAELLILPAGVLSSDGETLTVRLFSRVPLGKITEVYCDTDSHTSIALLQIVLSHAFGITPTITSLDICSLGEVTHDWPETVLIIGDKVVTCNTDSEYPHQLDLGKAWREQTGLPFVFATWLGREDLEDTVVLRVSMLLDRQLRLNTNRIEQVVSANADGRGWDLHLANRYLTRNMQYTFTEEHKKSLLLFFELACSLGLLNQVRPLRFYGDE